ncbi:MAG: M56 family metallopeptidase [Bryobacteraceae bacterium]|jgi:beta-lactamase regulating signal transducer with metallopeptidase domain
MTAIATALTAALLHFIWQGAIGGLLLWVLLFLLRGRSANARYAASCAALALLSALPVITALVVYHPAAPVPAIAHAVMPAFPIAGPAAISVHVSWLRLVRTWALPAWVLGVFLFSIRMVWGCTQVAALRRRGLRADEQVLALVGRLSARMGLTRPVSVLISAMADGPSVIGWLRPAILVPAASLVGLTPTQLEAVLAHELAHVLRYDYLVNILQMLVETLLFYHPAVWWISARIRRERELCCDDLAVRSCGDAIGYARALTALEKMRAAAPALALGSTDGPLLYRIQRLFGIAPHEYGPSRVSGIVALSIALVCVALSVNWARAQAPHDGQSYIEAGDSLLKQGKYDDAIQQYEEGVRKDPERKIPYLKHEIEAFLRQGKAAHAAAKNDEILKADPSDPEARGLRATIALDAGDLSGALPELQAVVAAKPDHFVARFNLGRAWVKSGEPEKARQEFETAIELRPDYIPARLALASLELQMGEYRAAAEQADAVLALAPANAEAQATGGAARQHLRKQDDRQKILRNFFGDERDTERRRLDALKSARNQVQDPDALLDLNRQIAAVDTSVAELERKLALLDSQAPAESQVKHLEAQEEVLLGELSTLNTQRAQLDAEVASMERELNELRAKLRTAAPRPQNAK